jgi:hypothetical protein
VADNVPITPGAGAQVAADDVGGVMYQRVKQSYGVDGAAVDVSLANPLPMFGSIDPRPTYLYNLPSQIHVNTANTVHWDLFNADATAIMRIVSVLQIPGVVTAVTGVAFDFKLARTTAIGTAGVAQAVVELDTTVPNLPAGVTCRSKPTGGATESDILRTYNISGEETSPATLQLAAMGGLELVSPAMLRAGGITLRQNQGLRCVQITQGAGGWTAWLIQFTVE